MVIGFAAMGIFAWVAVVPDSAPQWKQTRIWALVIAALLVDWRKLTEPHRKARYSGSGLLIVGIVAMIVGALMETTPVLMAGWFVGAAMIAQTMCPFVPHAKRSATRDDQAGQPVAPVQQIHDPSSPPSDHPTAPPAAAAEPGAPSAVLPHGVSPRNRGIAVALTILGFFPGIAGLQRFYVGKIWTGFFYLITWGFFYIGQIIDLIRICGGDFQDAKGRRLLLWDNRREFTAGPSTAPASAQRASSGFVAPMFSTASSIVSAVLGIIGYAMVFTSLAVVLLMTIDAPRMIAEGVIDPHAAQRLAHDLGASWPDIARRLGVLIASIGFGTGVIVLILARRRAGAMHLLRLLVAAALLGAVMATASQAVGGNAIDWSDIARLIHKQQDPSGALVMFLESFNNYRAVITGVMFVLSIVMFAWPPKKQYLLRQTVPTASGGVS